MKKNAQKEDQKALLVSACVLPDLTAAWEEGICTVNLCPVSDTGVPTLVETDTACAEGVPAVQTTWSRDQFKKKRYILARVSLPSKQNLLLPKHWNMPILGQQELGFQAELCIYSSLRKF